MWRTIPISISLCQSIKETIGSKRRGTKGKERDGGKKRKKKKNKKKNRAWVKFLERSNALKNICNFHNIFIIISKKKIMYMFGFSVCVCAFPFFFFFNAFHCFRRHRALFTGPTTTLFRKKKLKMGPTILFTHLENILLQCFQFLVFSFQQNKLYPNEPYMCQAVTSFNLCSLLTSLFLPNSDNL